MIPSQQWTPAHPRTFTVFGEPKAKPRMTRQDKWMKRPIVVQYRLWEDECKAVIAVPNGPLAITLKFFLPVPPSWSSKKRNSARGLPHTLKPDLDNLIKGCDGFIHNDQRITRIVAAKYYDDGKGCRMEVEFN